MKATLKIEAFGDGIAQEIRMMEGLICAIGGKKLWGESEKFPRPWVAHIMGRDLKFKYKREFLKPTKDYTHANSKGTRGVFLWYILESGNIYEVNQQISWKNWDRYFCTVDEEGDILKLEESDIDDAMFPEDPDWG